MADIYLKEQGTKRLISHIKSISNDTNSRIDELMLDIDNKFSELETNIDWKESVETYDDILTTYPEPEDGWTVNVNDTNYTYRYNGSRWIAISANAIPKATQEVDGLFTKEDKTKLNGIDENANNYVHPNDSGNKHIPSGGSAGQVLKWNSDGTAVWGDVGDADTEVIGVKGNNETEYRKGNVNLTAENVGALPLTGGTITGQLKAEEGIINHSWASGVDSQGYIHIATIKIPASYMDSPIEFDIITRNAPISTKVSILFTSVNGTDPSIKSFSKQGLHNVYIYKSAISTWDIYVQTKTVYEMIVVSNLTYGYQFVDKLDFITFKKSLIEILPTGYIEATLSTVDMISSQAVSDGNGNVISDTYALKSALTGAGIDANILQSNNIGSSLSFEDLIKKKVVTFFTNWSDTTNFPAKYGSGLFIPTLDGTDKIIYYQVKNNAWFGYVKLESDTVTLSNITWNKVGTTSDLANYLPLNGNAVSATKATQDGNGNVIADTYALNSDLGTAAYKTVVTSTVKTSSNFGTYGVNHVPDMNFIAYWNGAYTSSGNSNLRYCDRGEFGNAVTKGVDTKITSGSSNLITSGGAYSAIKGTVVWERANPENFPTFNSTSITISGSGYSKYEILYHSTVSTPTNTGLKCLNSTGLIPIGNSSILYSSYSSTECKRIVSVSSTTISISNLMNKSNTTLSDGNLIPYQVILYP